MTGNYNCTGMKTDSAMISVYTAKGVCQIMTDTEWKPRLTALMQLGFTYSDIVLISTNNSENRQYALQCLFQPLQTYLESFLIVFGWKEEGGILLSPDHSTLNTGDIIAIINNSRSAIVDRLTA